MYISQAWEAQDGRSTKSAAASLRILTVLILPRGEFSTIYKVEEDGTGTTALCARRNSLASLAKLLRALSACRGALACAPAARGRPKLLVTIL